MPKQALKKSSTLEETPTTQESQHVMETLTPLQTMLASSCLFMQTFQERADDFNTAFQILALSFQHVKTLKSTCSQEEANAQYYTFL